MLLQRLVKSKLVKTKRDGDSVTGEMFAALTQKGAAFAADNSNSLPGGKSHARDWLRHAHSHRTACNSVSAAAMATGYGVWTELCIQAGEVDEGRYSFGEKEVTKIADLLVEEEGKDGIVWVEVENSYRNDKDLGKVIGMMRSMFRNDVNHAPDKRYREVWFVITRPGAKNIGTRLRKALTHEDGDGTYVLLRKADELILAQHLKVFELDTETLELHPVPF